MSDGPRRAGEEVWNAGLHGVPTIAVEGRLFWGDDRLEDAVTAAA